MYQVNLIGIKEQVVEKGSTVSSHRNAEYMLTSTSTKHTKYVVNQKLKHFDDISFREPFGRIRVVFYKIRCVHSENKEFVSTWAIGLIRLIRLLTLSGEILCKG